MVTTIGKKLAKSALITCSTFGRKIFDSAKKNRFITWIIFIGLSLLVCLNLIQKEYLVTIPRQGGSITEAVVGSPRFINPVLAFSQVDKDLSNIIFSGLFTTNEFGEQIPELASDASVSNNGLEYIVTIREDALFHDGKPVTAEDVVFTIERIQDPLIKSPLQGNWYGVSAETISQNQIKFTLEKPYNNFLSLLSLGILPKHIWSDISVEEFPFSTRNINPIGSGPFQISELKRSDSERVTALSLKPFFNGIYRPYIEKLEFIFTKTENDQIAAFDSKLADTAAGIPAEKLEILSTKSTKQHTFNLPRVYSLFFNKKNNPALEYNEVREVIDRAIDRKKIIDEIFFGVANSNQSPLPITSKYFSEPTQEESDPEVLKKRLSSNGWKFDENSKVWKRTEKNGDELSLTLSLWTPDTSDIALVANYIKADLLQVGIPVTISTDDMQSFSLEVIRKRQFESVLFGYIAGIPADLFSFWHSSGKIDPGLNIAEYGSITVDKDLEAIKRATKEEEVEKSFRSLQAQIQKDRPAVFLFSPKFVYLTSNDVVIPNRPESLATPEDRFNSIESWYIKTEQVLPFFVK